MARKLPERRKPTRRAKSTRELRIDRFVAHFLIHLNGRKAAIEAGYSPDSARFTASELLADPKINAKIEVAMAERAKRLNMEADDVLRDLVAIAKADPRELIELQRRCCRYCFGLDHRYQRTPREMQEHRAAYDLKLLDLKLLGNEMDGLIPEGTEFDPEGGIGWDPRRDPNAECPECFGEGEQVVVTKDQRDISPDARLLYAGTKVNQNGAIEIKMHDQSAARHLIGQHHGMFKKGVELTGKGGKPIEHSNPQLAEIFAAIAGSDDFVGPAKSRRKHGA
jgi:hypothetical protein